MSSDNISIAVIEDFLKKVRLAAKSNQKEIKIPITEAENIAFNLNIVILRLLDKNQTTNKPNNDEIITINMDGGNL